jgi:hypothetical protein
MKKRIALIGNMNNNFFALVRYLRDAGYDAHLFYRIGVEHFQPKSDTFSLNFSSFCHEVNWFNNEFLKCDINLVKDQLKGFEFFIGQGDEAAIATKADIQFDVYYPYGSDFYKYAWLPQKFTLFQKVYLKFIKRFKWSEVNTGTQSYFIRQTIINAKNVWLDITNKDYEKKLLDLGLKGLFKNIPMPFIYDLEYSNLDSVWDVHWKSSIEKIREENKFLVLYHGRQEWKKSKTYNANNFTTKNTHHLIYGFAKFVKKYPLTKTKLVMIEYGGDVDNSKKLIFELYISEYVVWLPKMYRKDLMFLIKNVDVCSGEFNKSYLTFGTVIEAMLMGKPVLNYREEQLYLDKYKSLYPCYNVREAHEIFEALESAYFQPTERIKIGEDAKIWVENNFINQPLSLLIQEIETPCN